MRTEARQDLESELRDPEFRRLYGAAEAKSELAVAFAYARHGLGLTQEEMSEVVGVSQPYIAKLESGEANPTVGAIGSMLAILNLRLRMHIAPLLPRPISAGSADFFVFSETFGHKQAADTSELVIMADFVGTSLVGRRGQQGTLFPTQNYNPFTPLAEVNESLPAAMGVRSFAEANIGGYRA